MPKILINEKDRTSPGTPNNYSNYAVLIPGFAGDASAPTIEADSNGIYEFSTAETFKDTIGLVSPKIKRQVNDSVVEFYHYGNQMAYELLNMGYSVVYKVINDVTELASDKFWEIFRDRANYDFRFITHGLLKSSDIVEQADYINTVNMLNAVKIAIEQLEKIENEVTLESIGWTPESPNMDLELDEARKIAYDKIAGNFDGFIIDPKKPTQRYASFSAAMEALKGTADKNYEDGRKKTLEDQIEGLTNGAVTTDLINAANACIANLARYKISDKEEVVGRGDCIALIEIDERLYTSNINSSPEERVIQAVNAMSDINSDNGKYCALTVPSVTYNMAVNKEFDNNKKFPGAFHYLACFINSLKLGFAEWYAAAGYTRGVASYTVDRTTIKLGEIALNALEPRYYDDPQTDYPKFACNVIANFRGSYYLWGNRTAHPLGKKGNLETGDLVASSFLNIRQLCTTIKKQLYIACRNFTFDPNSDTLWVNFKNAITPTLDLMKADQGISDYKILKVATDKKATLKAKIRIIPIEAVEDFDLEVSLEDSFGETTANVTE